MSFKAFLLNRLTYAPLGNSAFHNVLLAIAEQIDLLKLNDNSLMALTSFLYKVAQEYVVFKSRNQQITQVGTKGESE